MNFKDGKDYVFCCHERAVALWGEHWVTVLAIYKQASEANLLEL